MEAHVLKPELAAAPRELRLPVGAQRERRVAAADGVLPDVFEWSAL